MANGFASENLDNGIGANLGKPHIPLSPSVTKPISTSESAITGETVDDLPATNGHETNGGLAGEEVAAESMTGLAVPAEPITESAKAVSKVAATSETTDSSDDRADHATSQGMLDLPDEPAEVTLEHTVSVDAPVSDLRGVPEPARNPAQTNGDSGAHDPLFDESQGETAGVSRTGDPATVRDQPQSPISPPEERMHEDVEGLSLPTTKKEPTSVPTPPHSSAAASPRPGSNVLDNSGAADSSMADLPSSTPASQPTPVTSVKHDRSEEPSEPSAKRARTDDGSNASTPTAGPAQADPQRIMTPNRQKYCLQVLRQLKRSKDAPPFLQPVDPVKLKIPDYPKIVTNPQDLGTIESKLKKSEYDSIDAFIDSVELVWANCQKYNGPESPINLMALRLKELFERQIRTMPPPEAFDSKTGTGKAGGKQKKIGKPSPGAPLAAAPRSRNTSSPAAVNIRRESIGVDGRPKREIHAPPPKSLPYQNAPQRRGKNAVQLKFCTAVLKELTHKKHEAFAFPFYVPVDAKALGLHDYHTVIRNPMDLGTMQSKLSAGEYESADDFEYDMRLMFRNCYKYNGPGQPVNTMGHRLESVFNEKWAEKPIPRPEGYGSDSEEDSGPDDQGKQTVQMLTKQLEAMKNQIASINSQKKKKKPKRDRYDDDDDDGGMGPRDSDLYKPGKKGGRKRRDSLEDLDESPMFPSFEQKTALSTKMGYMTEHQMPVVIQILKRTDPNFDPEDEEVELDVDKVHPKTIRLLWNWIMDDIQPSFMRKKVPKPKKNRNVLSENEQQRQIEQLEAQLNKFNGDGGDAYGYDSRYGNIPNDDSSDSDSDASSEEDD